MLRLTKIFHFETAHAILGYPGVCKDIHGHSYELHVTVSSPGHGDTYIPAPGLYIDFKVIKRIVNEVITHFFDHKLVLSKEYLSKNPGLEGRENMVILDAEPSAENLLLYISGALREAFPPEIRLDKLLLYETKDSYAEWFPG